MDQLIEIFFFNSAVSLKYKLLVGFTSPGKFTSLKMISYELTYCSLWRVVSSSLIHFLIRPNVSRLINRALLEIYINHYMNWVFNEVQCLKDRFQSNNYVTYARVTINILSTDHYGWRVSLKP